MRGYRSALEPAARTHGLGALISLHRRERPLVRFRARAWCLLLGGPLVGLVFAGYNATLPARHEYELYPDGVFLGTLAAVYVLALVLAGPVAARLLPADGPPRWVALFEQGLADVRLDDAGDPVVRVVRFEQFRHAEQHRGATGVTPRGMARVVTATSPAARLVADRDGERLVLDYDGYRHQDRFVDAVRAHLAGGPSHRSGTTLRRRGRVSFGNLVITGKALTVAGGAGLRAAEEPVLRWADVVQVNERDDGTVTIYRRSRPGEPAGPYDSAVWYSAVVPDATDAVAMITKLRNKALP